MKRIESVNDFVIKFANVNGTGSASANNLFAKALFFAFCFLWFRASFPRYRYDQIMRLGWKVFIPITIVWIFVTALAAYNNWFVLGA